MAKKTAQPGAPQPKKPKQKKIRLDDLLVERGYFADRGEALRAVLAHEVRANDVYPTSAAVLGTSSKGRLMRSLKMCVAHAVSILVHRRAVLPTVCFRRVPPKSRAST